MSTSNLGNAVDFFNAIWKVADSAITTNNSDFVGTYVYNPEQYYYRIEIPQNVRVYDEKYPPVNLWVDDKSLDIVFEFAVAGIPKDKIHIDFEEGSMILEIDSVEGVREGFTLSQKGIRTRKSKTFYSVPFNKYNVDEAKATLENGILTIAIPARDEIKPRRLEIE